MNNEDLYCDESMSDVLDIRGNPFAEVEFKRILKNKLGIINETTLDKIWNSARTFKRIKVEYIKEFALGILKDNKNNNLNNPEI